MNLFWIASRGLLVFLFSSYWFRILLYNLLRSCNRFVHPSLLIVHLIFQYKNTIQNTIQHGGLEDSIFRTKWRASTNKIKKSLKLAQNHLKISKILFLNKEINLFSKILVVRLPNGKGVICLVIQQIVKEQIQRTVYFSTLFCINFEILFQVLYFLR